MFLLSIFLQFSILMKVKGAFCDYGTRLSAEIVSSVNYCISLYVIPDMEENMPNSSKWKEKLSFFSSMHL